MAFKSAEKAVKKDQSIHLGPLKDQVAQASQELKSQKAIDRLWQKDATLWKNDPKHIQVIQNRLGWLSSIDWLLGETKTLLDFQQKVRSAKFEHAVLLGMGGSSLAPEVLRQTFQSSQSKPQFILLDSTDPAQVLAVHRLINPLKTLFIVSTKSGTTLETLSFYRYFYEIVKQSKGAKAGENFVAITDPGTPLEKEAKALSFFQVFINPADIGGRFSVMSYFGMVPAAVMGIDVGEILKRMKQEKERSTAQISLEENPGAMLGLMMAEAAKRGRDKMTLLVSPSISSYGLWAEQLIAESLGKDEKGVVPIYGDLLDIWHKKHYDDRIFVYLSCGKKDPKLETLAGEFEHSNLPVIRIHLADEYDLGAQFYRWSIATAVAGMRFGINPFDEPNVQAAKDMTNANLKYLAEKGHFPDLEPKIVGKSIRITVGKSERSLYSLGDFLKKTQKGDYLVLAAYLPYRNTIEIELQKVREKLSQATHIPTMFGFGPRYLHSTGQLHKGGPNNCVAIVFTSGIDEDAAIPGQPFTFGQLEYAQALGDFQALEAKGRRVLHCHVTGKLIEEGIKEFQSLLGS